MFEDFRYGWMLALALVLPLRPAAAGAQVEETIELSKAERSPSTDAPGEQDASSVGDALAEDAPSPSGPPVGSAAVTVHLSGKSAARSPSSGRKQPDSRNSGNRLPRHVSLRLYALSNHLDALAERGSSSVYPGLFSLALGGASIALAVFVADPALPTYLYVFGSVQAARGISGLLLVPDPDEPALRFAQMPTTSVRTVKRRLRFGGYSLDRLASRNRWARWIDGTLLISAGALSVPLLLVRDDFAFDSALDYFVVAGAGLSLLVGTATLLIPTEAEKRYDSYLAFRQRIKRQWQERRRRAATAPSFRAALLPTRGGAVVLARLSF